MHSISDIKDLLNVINVRNKKNPNKFDTENLIEIGINPCALLIWQSYSLSSRSKVTGHVKCLVYPTTPPLFVCILRTFYGRPTYEYAIIMKKVHIENSNKK